MMKKTAFCMDVKIFRIVEFFIVYFESVFKNIQINLKYWFENIDIIY